MKRLYASAATSKVTVRRYPRSPRPHGGLVIADPLCGSGGSAATRVSAPSRGGLIVTVVTPANGPGPARGSVIELLDDAATEDLLDDGAADITRLLDVLVVVTHCRVVGHGLARLVVVGRSRPAGARPRLREGLPHGAGPAHGGVRRRLGCWGC